MSFPEHRSSLENRNRPNRFFINSSREQIFLSDPPLDTDTNSVKETLPPDNTTDSSDILIANEDSHLLTTQIVVAPEAELHKELQQQPPPPSISDKVIESDPVTYSKNFDQIFNPTKLGDNIIPFLSYPELLSTNRSNYSADIDLRLIPTGASVAPSVACHSRDNTNVVSNSGKLPFTIPHNNNTHNHSSSHNHHRKRNYTLYDAHIDDPEFLSKRARYFFNPRSPHETVNSSRSLPSHSGASHNAR